MATQQPTARPWFRLASMARPPSAPAPAPAPVPTPAPAPQAPQPRPLFVRPTFSQTFITPTVQRSPPQELVTPPPPPPQPTTQAPAQPPSQSTPPPPVPPSPIAPPPPRADVAPPSPPPQADVAPPSPPPQAGVLQPSPPPRAAPAPPSPPPMAPLEPISSVPTLPIIKTSPISTALPIASSSLPPSPKPRAVFVPSSPLPTTPPPPKPVSPSPAPASPISTALPIASSSLPVAAPTATMIVREATPTPSPQIAKLPQPRTPSPPHKVPSPRINPLTPPPSPLTLPPAQLMSDMEHHPNIPPEAEQKTILVQETIGITPKVHVSGSHSPGIALNGKRDLTRDNNTKDKGNNYKKLPDSEEFGTRIITTIAGENKGAIMELGPTPNSRKKRDFGGGNPHGLHIKGSLKGSSGVGKSRSEDSNTSNEEGMMKTKDKRDKTAAAISSPPMSAFMNSNVQGVNNSILFNCSCTHHDPGVHLSLSRNANSGGGHGIHIKDRTNG